MKAKHKNKAAHGFDYGDQQVFRGMVKHFRHAHGIVCEHGEQLAGTVPGVKIKGQGFVLRKQFPTHGSFHFSAHGVAKVSVQNVTDYFDTGQQYQYPGSCEHFRLRGRVPLGKNFPGQIPGYQRE